MCALNTATTSARVPLIMCVSILCGPHPLEIFCSSSSMSWRLSSFEVSLSFCPRGIDLVEHHSLQCLLASVAPSHSACFSQELYRWSHRVSSQCLPWTVRQHTELGVATAVQGQIFQMMLTFCSVCCVTLGSGRSPINRLMMVQMATAACLSCSDFRGNMGCFNWRWIQEGVAAPWK